MLLWETLCVWTLSISQTSLGWCMNLTSNAEAAEVQRARMELQYKIHPKLQVKHLLIRNQTRKVFGHRVVETLKKNYYTSDEIDPNLVPVKTEELVQTLSENIWKKQQSLSSIGAFLKGDWPADCHEHAISKAGISWQTQTRWLLCVLKACSGETWFDLCMFQSVLPGEPTFRSDNPRDTNWKCCGPVLSPNIKSIAFFVVTAGWLLLDYRHFTYMELRRQSGR